MVDMDEYKNVCLEEPEEELEVGFMQYFISKQNRLAEKMFLLKPSKYIFDKYDRCCAETNPKAVPQYYTKKTYATRDYTNKSTGGLRFKKGDVVYVLLRNGNGWCTGMYPYYLFEEK